MVEQRKVHIESFSQKDIASPANERRLPVQLCRYWEKIRGTRLMPSEQMINPEDIPHLWEHCYLIQVNDLENRRRADFTYLGSEIIQTYREHLSEEDALDIIFPNSSRLAQNFQQVIDSKLPILQAGEFITSRGGVMRFRQCLLPIGETDDKVDAIFGCVNVFP